MTISQLAVRNGIDNVPPPDVVARMVKTAHGLERIRTACGNRAIRISSGYRSPEVNRLVGGVSNPPSQHTTGEAADFTVAKLTPRQVVEIVSQSGIEFDQLILEFNSWVHVSFTDNPRGNVLTAVRGPDGKTKYLKGIV